MEETYDININDIYSHINDGELLIILNKQNKYTVEIYEPLCDRFGRLFISIQHLTNNYIKIGEL